MFTPKKKKRAGVLKVNPRTFLHVIFIFLILYFVIWQMLVYKLNLFFNCTAYILFSSSINGFFFSKIMWKVWL